MTPVVLFRGGYDDPREGAIASRHMPVVERRSAVPAGSLVIGRYSVLPFYRELAEDLAALGSSLINTYRQHRYLADMGNWYRDLRGITPETWTHLDAVPADAWPCVLKGETNSKKYMWSTHMFAHDRSEALDVWLRLQQDGLLCDQAVYLRKFVPLVKVADDVVIGGPPISKEYRFFVCDGQIVAKGFYWSSHSDVAQPAPNVDEVPAELLRDAIERVGKNARFWVMDVAQTQAGPWIVVELNDGQMSGLSDCDPDELYRNLNVTLTEQCHA